MAAERIDVLRAMDMALEYAANSDFDGADAECRELREARATVADLIVSHSRLLRMAEKARLPKTGDQCVLMTEARRLCESLGDYA